MKDFHRPSLRSPQISDMPRERGLALI